MNRSIDFFILNFFFWFYVSRICKLLPIIFRYNCVTTNIFIVSLDAAMIKWIFYSNKCTFR